MARAIWKGVLAIGSERVPVKLYSAVEDRGVHFRLLAHSKHEPVRQQLVDPQTGEVVAYADVQRGLALGGEDAGSFVVLKKEELAQLAPQSSRDIAVAHFIPRSQLGPEWYVRPYYLGPDGDEQTYFAVADALAAEREEGLAHWVMRGHEYAGLLREEDGYLALIALRHTEEVVRSSELPQPEGRAHSEKEQKMAEQLVAAFADRFDPNQYHDAYRERVLSFVAAKAQGRAPRLKRPVNKRPEQALSDALAKSLARARKERGVA